MSQLSPAPDGANEFEHNTTSKAYFLPLIAVVAIIVYLLLTWDENDQFPGDGSDHSAVGKPLLAIAVEPLSEGQAPVSLDTLRGKVTLVNYWGPWCYYCLAEMPDLVTLNEELAAEPDFFLLSVTCSDSPTSNYNELRSDSYEIMEEFGASWPLYVDPNQSSRAALVESANLRGFGFPTTVLIDRDGKIAGLWEGYMEGMHIEIEQAVRETLAKSSTSQQ